MTAVVLHRKSSGVSVTDLFCGAGGSSSGATEAGADVKIALNHWDRAVETHSSNFPNTFHEVADISNSNPRRYAATDLLIASPECTNQTGAKGIARKYQQSDLFGFIPDPAAERSRATMFDVPRFAEAHNYNLIVIENVVEARFWVMWDAWIHAMKLLGYEHKEIYFNSMFAHPVPQSRDRLYVVFWKKGNKAPNLDFYPRAFCPKCAIDVESVQCWKNPQKPYGDYRTQYTYNCPTCATRVEPYYYCAANAIDWSYPIERIGERTRPLKDKTRARIQAGIDKFSGRPLLFSIDQSRINTNLKLLFEEAIPTQTTSTTMGMAIPPPFLIDAGGIRNTQPRTVLNPYPTQTTRRQPCVVLPFVFAPGSNGLPKAAMEQPLPTQVTAVGSMLTIMPFLLQVGHGGPENNSRVREISQPLPTQHTLGGAAVAYAPFILPLSYGGDRRMNAIEDALPTQIARQDLGVAYAPYLPYLMQYNGTSQGLHPVTDALGTQTALDRHALALLEQETPTVDDCYFRTLRPHEVQAAMGFAKDYIITGNNRDKIRQLGNAVCPQVMTLIMERCLATLKG